MPLTESYKSVLSPILLQKYSFAETRNAAQVISAACPNEWAEVLNFLDDYQLRTESLMKPGGRKSKVVEDLESFFYDNGWKETRVDSELLVFRVPKETGKMFPIKLGGKGSTFQTTEQRLKVSDSHPYVQVRSTFQEGYLIDALKGKLAVDIEWNAKDGNLDRDIAAYRAWYDFEEIAGAILITKDWERCKKLVNDIWSDYLQTIPPERRDKLPIPVDLGTSTTTSIEKAKERIKRGDAGGCPVLVIGITENCWDKVPYRSLEL